MKGRLMNACLFTYPQYVARHPSHGRREVSVIMHYVPGGRARDGSNLPV
jgi:hypothetical protein